MAKSISEKRAKNVERAMNLIWLSLKSHMGSGGTYGKPIKNVGNPAFHKRCIREYSEVIKLLSELY